MDKRADHNIYGFIPSAAACIVFIILFAITSAAHIWQLIRAKCWYFVPFVVGGACEFVGFDINWTATDV